MGKGVKHIVYGKIERRLDNGDYEVYLVQDMRDGIPAPTTISAGRLQTVTKWKWQWNGIEKKSNPGYGEYPENFKPHERWNNPGKWVDYDFTNPEYSQKLEEKYQSGKENEFKDFMEVQGRLYDVIFSHKK